MTTKYTNIDINKAHDHKVGYKSYRSFPFQGFPKYVYQNWGLGFKNMPSGDPDKDV
jgi:hypothetical protein